PPEDREPGPWPLGVDVVGGERRDAAPVVDACLGQAREIGVGEIGRYLDVHLRTEQEPGHRGRSQDIVYLRFGVVAHRNARLPAEVLYDDLLDVPVALMEIADREQGLDALGEGLADSDENAGGEGDGQLAGERDRAETPGRH